MAETGVGEARRAGAVEFEGVTPILRVGNLAASLEHYVKVLGFKVDWQDPGIIALVSRGRCHLMLCEDDQGHAGGWVWIGVDAIEPLFEEYRAAGARVRHSPTNYSWAYEMQIEDVDGNVLRMGAEPKDGVPMGEWLDGRGDVWVKSGTGAWTRKCSQDSRLVEEDDMRGRAKKVKRKSAEPREAGKEVPLRRF